jgi:hypothetical protein
MLPKLLPQNNKAPETGFRGADDKKVQMMGPTEQT